MQEQHPSAPALQAAGKLAKLAEIIRSEHWEQLDWDGPRPAKGDLQAIAQSRPATGIALLIRHLNEMTSPADKEFKKSVQTSIGEIVEPLDWSEVQDPVDGLRTEHQTPFFAAKQMYRANLA